jgi:Kdo2-lipid IVA lauroyltransferase/acyltransferase
MLGQQRRLALQHLTLAYGEYYTPTERAQITRRMFQHLGMNALEWMVYPRLRAIDLQRLVRCDAHDLDKVRAAAACGHGVIFLSAHFGNWEFLAAYFATHGYRGGVVARRLRYPEYEAWQISMRRNKHVDTFVRDTGGWRTLVRRLRANDVVGIMPDQDIDSVDGVFVDFFGRRAYTPTGPTLLAMQTGAVILPTFIVRERRTFHVVVHDPVPVAQTGDRRQDVVMTTQAWTGIIEAMIRQHPEQWVWMHRRWKTHTQPTTD